MRSVIVEDLGLRYGPVAALQGVSFAVQPGEIFGLLGPNGAGKTSVLRVLVGLRRPGSGRAQVLGYDVATHLRTVRRLVGYVPQAVSADGSLSGRENLTFFARLYGLRGGKRRSRVEHLLHLIDLEAVAGQLVQTYSGGMVRRLEVACALVASPQVLLLDEPTLGLDPAARRSVWAHLHTQSAETGMSVLVTTHYMEEAQEHCDRVAVLSSGQVLAEATPTALRAGMAPDARLEDVFLALTATSPDQDTAGFRAAGRARRTGRRLG